MIEYLWLTGHTQLDCSPGKKPSGSPEGILYTVLQETLTSLLIVVLDAAGVALRARVAPSSTTITRLVRTAHNREQRQSSIATWKSRGFDAWAACSRNWWQGCSDRAACYVVGEAPLSSVQGLPLQCCARPWVGRGRVVWEVAATQGLQDLAEPADHWQHSVDLLRHMFLGIAIHLQ